MTTFIIIVVVVVAIMVIWVSCHGSPLTASQQGVDRAVEKFRKWMEEEEDE